MATNNFSTETATADDKQNYSRFTSEVAGDLFKSLSILECARALLQSKLDVDTDAEGMHIDTAICAAQDKLRALATRVDSTSFQYK